MGQMTLVDDADCRVVLRIRPDGTVMGAVDFHGVARDSMVVSVVVVAKTLKRSMIRSIVRSMVCNMICSLILPKFQEITVHRREKSHV